MAQNLSLAHTMGDDPDVKRDVVIKLLVTQTERDAMQAAADEDGITLSEWIRRRCIKTTTTIEVTPQSREQWEAESTFHAVHGRRPTADELAAEVARLQQNRRATITNLHRSSRKKGGK